MTYIIRAIDETVITDTVIWAELASVALAAQIANRSVSSIALFSGYSIHASQLRIGLLHYCRQVKHVNVSYLL